MFIKLVARKRTQQRSRAVKVIFLDIDGVLNSRASAFLQALDGGGSLLKPHAIHGAILNAIIAATQANVVITSAQRRIRTLAQIVDSLDGVGFSGKFIGMTPTFNAGPTRGAEIKVWLKDHRNVDGICIIDGNSDMDDLLPYLIQTITEEGLLATHVLPAIQILSKPWKRGE
jgi:hypothetical protein